MSDSVQTYREFEITLRVVGPLPFTATIRHSGSFFPPGQVEANTEEELVAAAHAWVDRWLDADA